MSFLVFLAVNLVLFIRPAEIFEGLEEVPIYENLMLLGMLLTAPSMLAQLSLSALRKAPITACVIGVFVAILISTTLKVSGTDAYEAGQDFGRVIIFYLMLNAVISSVERLRTYLLFLTFCFVALAALPLGQLHGAIALPGLQALEQVERTAEGQIAYTVMRLQGTGIFNDPNDLAMIMVAGLAVAGALRRPGNGRSWLPWILVCAPMFTAMILTHSRGGIAAFLVMLTCWFGIHRGWTKAVALMIPIAPALLFLIGGRVGEVDGAMTHGTGQARLQLWSNVLGLSRAHFPLGMGYGQTPEHNDGLVAHNSFLHCFGELGLVGGAAFLGATVTAAWALLKSPIYAQEHEAKLLEGVRPALFCAVVGSGTAMLFVSRQYTLCPYLVLGLAASWCRLAGTSFVLPQLRFDGAFCLNLAKQSVAFLGLIYVFINVFVRFS